jgi:hypothetical protein
MNNAIEDKEPNVLNGNRARTHAMGSIFLPNYDADSTPTPTDATSQLSVRAQVNTPPTTPRTTSKHLFVPQIGVEIPNPSLEWGYQSDESVIKELEAFSKEQEQTQHKP